MLRIAVQSKGRLFEDTLHLLAEADIKISSSRRTLLAQSTNFPLEVLYLRDDDIPQSVASGVADIGVVGDNEYEERGEPAEVIERLGFSKCRLSLAIPKEIDYDGLQWFEGKKVATSYPNILCRFMESKGIHIEVHVITGSVEISPGIGLADAIFDIVSSGSTLVSNNLREVEVVMQSEALLIGHKGMDETKRETLKELLFRIGQRPWPAEIIQHSPQPFGRDCRCAAGLEEPHHHPPCRRSLVLCSHSSRPTSFLGNHRSVERTWCTGHSRHPHRKNDIVKGSATATKQ